MTAANSELLSQLRIDRNAEPPPSKRGLWLALAGAVVALVLVIAAWKWFGRPEPVEVATAPVISVGGGVGGVGRQPNSA